MKRFHLLLLSAFFTISAATQNCVPLDYGFGISGISTALSGNNSFNSGKIVVQADNKILQVYTDYGGIFGLVRHKSNGGLDSSFGTNGKVETEVGNWGNANSVVVQPDGKIIVVGGAYDGVKDHFALVRYHANGQLDSSFGVNGKMMTSVGATYAYGYDVTLQADGKILVAGASADNNYISSYAVVRYHVNGIVDSSFGENGRSIFHVGPLVGYIYSVYYGRYASEWARVIAVQQDGKIIVGGSSYALFNCWDYYGGIYCDEAFGMARLNANGIVDSSFGINGRVRDSIALRSASSMALQADGKILVTGYGYQPAFTVERYNSNGGIDLTFGNNGKLVKFIGGPATNSESVSVAAYSNGNIVVSGIVHNNDQFIGVAKFLPNGNSDSSFNDNGSVVFQVNQATSVGLSLALQNDKIVVGGRTDNGTTEKVILARFSDNSSVISPLITAAGPLTLCNGNSVKLVSSEAGSIQWTRNNVPIAAATDTVYYASQTGSYRVWVTNINGCGSSPPVDVTVKTGPPTPPITWSTPQLSTAPGYLHYEWAVNNAVIAGLDTNAFRPTQTGEYKVRVTDSLGCSNTSHVFTLRVLAVSDLVIGDSKLRYYPNPVQSILYIDVSNPNSNKFEAQLYDVSGKLVHKQSLNRDQNQVAVQKLPTGIYQLVIGNDVKKVSVKLIVTR